MLFSQTTATERIAKLSKRYRAVQGGTSASKTISILLVLIAQAQSDKTPTLTSVVSESFPHLKKGAMRDFFNILEGHGYYNEALHNKTDNIYTFETGSKIEFFGVDSADKVRGPRRDRLFVNEANNVSYGAYSQLEVRTREQVWLDWNPTNEFWFYSELLANPEIQPDLDHIIITYRHNQALDPAIVKSIEARRTNKSWWTVYGEGQLGEVEGKIYKGWRIIDQVPHEARLERRPLDFGFSNDPTAIVDIYYHNGGYIFDELLYRKGMVNREIATFLNNQEKPNTLVVGDSAEPKSIAEIASFGVPIIGAQKGPGSVSAGIDFIQGQQISVTKRSTNIIKEYRNYLWKTDKEERILNVPEDLFNHTMDAIRYGMESLRPKEDEEEEVSAPDITSLIY